MRILEGLIPQWLRLRRAAQPEQNDKTLARVDDTHPVYRALMDHAAQLMESAAGAALAPDLPDAQRQWLCGRASGLLAFIDQVEHTRARAKEEEVRRP
jgi:hypothetical protein